MDEIYHFVQRRIETKRPSRFKPSKSFKQFGLLV